MNAASGTTFEEMRTAPTTRALIGDAFLEIIALAEARGVSIKEDALGGRDGPA